MDTPLIQSIGPRRVLLLGLTGLIMSGLGGHWAVAQEIAVEGPLNDKRPLTAEDLAFLRAEGRLRKQKQIVRLDGLRTAGEAKVLASAIDAVIIFCGSLSYGLVANSPGRNHVTAHGIAVLELPPSLPHDATQRHHVSRLTNWDVRSIEQLVVTAEFSDTSGVRPPVMSQRLVFVRDAGVWKFDHYDK